MAAHWRFAAGDGEPATAGEHGSFSETAGSLDDPELAAAMSRAIDQITATLRPVATRRPR